MADDEIIRRRLMIDGDGTGDVRLMAGFMKSFIKWCNVDESPQESHTTMSSVNEADSAICDAKSELEVARKVRCNRLEYDALAKLIKEHPPRMDTHNKLTELNSELKSLKEKRNELDECLQLRRKQLHALVTTLQQLKEGLENGTTSDEGNNSIVAVDLTQENNMLVDDVN